MIEHFISNGLSVHGRDDRLHLHLPPGLNATSLNPEQASELRVYINSWLYEYWQRSDPVVAAAEGLSDDS